MADDAQRIKDNIDIATVVSDYVDLQPAGQYLKGKSPFTDERDPSFYISPEKGLYHCFSSGQGGDVFTFIQEIEGVEFREALEILADRTGISLSGSSGDSGQTKRLRKLVQEAVDFYRQRLQQNDQPQTYLREREIQPDTAEQFNLGFAPDDWRQLLSHLEDSGFTTEDIITAGLAKRSDPDSSPYDRFRNRLMFPIHDTAGRAIAFSGRRLDPDDPAKYINSPETPLFRKKEALFGFHVAKQPMRELDAAILVEGQTDLVLVHQAGFGNVVASSGTAVTKNHLQLIRRFTDNLILALDTDEAGRNSTLKTARLALSAGMTPKVANLPDGQDPADIVTQNGSQALQSVVTDAEHAIPTAVGWATEASSDRRDFLEKLQDQILPLVTSIDNAITRDHFIAEIAKQSDVREKTIRSEIDSADSQPRARSTDTQPVLEATTELTRRERQNEIERELQALQSWQEQEDEPAVDPNDLQKRITAIQDLKVRDSTVDVDDDQIFATEITYREAEPEELSRAVEELLLHFKEVVLQEAYEAASAQVARSDDKDTKQTLLNKCQNISQQLKNVREQIRDHA